MDDQEEKEEHTEGNYPVNDCNGCEYADSCCDLCIYIY